MGAQIAVYPLSSSTPNIEVGAADANLARNYWTLLPSSVYLEGEQFAVEQEAGWIYLAHPQWSLVGMGSTVDEAMQDLEDEARSLALTFRDLGPRPLSEQSKRLRAFVRRVA